MSRRSEYTARDDMESAQRALLDTSSRVRLHYRPIPKRKTGIFRRIARAIAGLFK